MKFTAGVAGASMLIALGTLGLAGCAPVVGANPPDRSSDSAPTASPSPESTGTEFTVESLEIKTGLDAETLGKTLIEDRFTDWLNAGADQETMNAWLDFNGTFEDFLPTIINPISKTFTQALFIPNYRDSPLDADLQSSIDGSIRANSATVGWFISTLHSDKPEDLEPYRQWTTVDAVEELPNDVTGNRTLRIDYTDHSNADRNTANPLTMTQGTYEVTFQSINGTEKIAAISVSAR